MKTWHGILRDDSRRLKKEAAGRQEPRRSRKWPWILAAVILFVVLHFFLHVG